MSFNCDIIILSRLKIEAILNTIFKLIFSLSLLIPYLGAKDLKFAVVSKEYRSPFFLLSKAGCEDAASSLDGVECLYKGGVEANARLQDEIIEQLVRDKVDGIAVAVIKSDFISQRSVQLAKEAGIPLITYDSDLEDKHKNLRLAYIGSDNFELGVALGNELKRIRPNGGMVCIQAGVKGSINLKSRINGVRFSLSNQTDQFSIPKRLSGENSWAEYERCPFYSWEDRKRAFNQLKTILDHEEEIAFIAVGGWVQYYEHYREVMKPYQKKIINGTLAFIVADATTSQRELLKDGYSYINIGQNPYEMGSQAIKTLYNIVTGKEYQKLIHTPLTKCTRDNYKTCTQSLK